MHDWNARLRWWMVLGLALVTIAAVACSSDDSDETTTPPDASASADETYLTTIRTLAEAAEQRNEEIFSTLEEAVPTDLEFLGALADLLPEAIAEAQRQISELEQLTVPAGYTVDHDLMLTYLRANGELLERQLEAAEARDDLASRDLQIEIGTLQRNLLANLSESFRDSVLVGEEAIAAGEIFGGLTPEEAAYVNSVDAAYEEFRSRNAVFGQTLRQQFSDSRALLEALQGAGAGTAFEAVQSALLQVEPPERFATDHALLLAYLEEAVRLDREIGRAIDEVDPVLFVVSNLQLGGEFFVETVIGLSPPVVEIAFPGVSVIATAPDPSVLSDDYLGQLYAEVRLFRVRFGQSGPDYLAFNLEGEYAMEVVDRMAPGYIAIAESALERIRSLVPPDDVRADHELVIKYFEEVLRSQQDIFAAVTDSDVPAIRGGMLQAQSAFCDAGTGISDALMPAVRVLFEGPPNDRDLERRCGGAPG